MSLHERHSREYYEFVNNVSVAVRSDLGKELWFRGVCLDGIDSYFNEHDLPGAIRHAHDETIYWDRPKQLD